MAKENKVEYKRADEKDDGYRRILAKFNPHFLRSADIEIEFIPYLKGVELGKDFVSRIDSFSTIDIYRWMVRRESVAEGIGGWKQGYIPPIGHNRSYAKDHVELYRRGKLELEPRQIISRAKRVYENIADVFSEATAFAYNKFLLSGQLASFPYGGEAFTIDNLRYVVEESSYRAKNSGGEWVERSLAEHLFDVHKTKYVAGAILFFLEWMRELRIETGKELEKEKYTEKMEAVE